MSKRVKTPEADAEMVYDVWQSDMKVASVTGRGREAFGAALHYAFVYGQDGPMCTIKSRRARRKSKRGAAVASDSREYGSKVNRADAAKGKA